MVTLKLTKQDGTKVEKTVEKPKYGGTFVGAWDRPVSGWDDGFSYNPYLWGTHAICEELFEGDWYRSPTGTNEGSMLLQGTWTNDVIAPFVAESWEVPDSQTIIFHIRKGIYWHDKPPVNGRELTGDDVYFTMNRALTLETHRTGSQNKQYVTGLEQPDKWTVVLKVVEGRAGFMFHRFGGELQMVAPEVIEAYGGMREAVHVIGTGPYMVADHVPGSSVTFERNPNYWGTDPLHPENQLPYLDVVKWLIIVDASTRLAALRTHKIDWLQRVGWENAQTFMRTNPELKSAKFLQAAHLDVIFMRLDKPELPFQDKRVRRALMLALDNKTIKDEFYGGNAEIMSCPVAPYPVIMRGFTPLEEQSAEVQENYGYHPDKAKQLMAEAGYPDGFKTEVICQPGQADILSIVKSYWADIGVDLKIDVKEYGVWMGYRRSRNHNEMLCQSLSSVAPLYPLPQHQPHISPGYIDDPKINEASTIIASNLVVNEAKSFEALKGIAPYILDQCYWVEPPSPYLWTMWTPWIKGYNGEWTVGMADAHNFIWFIWMDQDLKEEMTGRR